MGIAYTTSTDAYKYKLYPLAICSMFNQKFYFKENIGDTLHWIDFTRNDIWEMLNQQKLDVWRTSQMEFKCVTSLTHF